MLLKSSPRYSEENVEEVDGTSAAQATDVTHILVKEFNGLNIDVYGTYEEPLFKAKDIGDLLGIEQIRKTIQNLDSEDKVLQPGNSITGFKEQYFLTENGLYEVLFISRKAIAKKFKKWVKGHSSG